jgi:hypothetical protein
MSAHVISQRIKVAEPKLDCKGKSLNKQKKFSEDRLMKKMRQ